MKALTIGGAMVDTIAIIDDALIERMSMSNAGKTFLLLEQGSKTEASSITTHCGGGAINAAVSLARTGFEVRTIAKVGRDQRAAIVRSALEAEGVSTAHLCVSATSPTGASAILSAHDRNAAVFTFRGSNTELLREDLDVRAFDGADLVYVATLSGQSADHLEEIVTRARKTKSAFIAVNPGIRQITGRFSLLRRALHQIDALSINRSEAEALVRQAVGDLSGSENMTLRRLAAAALETAREAAGPEARHDMARALVAGLLQLGAKQVLLTDGKYGAYAGTREEVLFCPALEVPVASSVGAGDAFGSTFAGSLVSGASRTDALITASVNAASVVGEPDAQTGLLRHDELQSRLAAARKKLKPVRWTTPVLNPRS